MTRESGKISQWKSLFQYWSLTMIFRVCVIFRRRCVSGTGRQGWRSRPSGPAPPPPSCRSATARGWSPVATARPSVSTTQTGVSSSGPSRATWRGTIMKSSNAYNLSSQTPLPQHISQKYVFVLAINVYWWVRYDTLPSSGYWVYMVECWNYYPVDLGSNHSRGIF